MDRVLQGIHVVVTRPAHQAEQLCEMIESAGGHAIRFPVLDIADVTDTKTLDAIIDRLEQFDIAIFISPNAVTHALTHINAKGGLPAQMRVAAVGQASAKALSAYGITVDLFPEQTFNSEALLALPELQQVAGKQVVIFRGVGGRELLADTLKQRGAQVEYAECYQRVRPNTDVRPLQEYAENGAVDIIIITSNEGLQNLFDMVGESGHYWLLQTPLLLVSERTAEFARQLGFTREAIIATKASDTALLQSLLDWRQSRH